MNIYEKLVEVRKTADYLKKNNSGFQFKYVSSSQTLLALREKMDEMKLLLIPEITNTKITNLIEGKNSKGNVTIDILTELTIKYTWINAEKPDEKIDIMWYGQGLDTNGEKGVGKALTYSEKYFLLKFFNIATDKDDPDAHQEKPPSRNNVTSTNVQLKDKVTEKHVKQLKELFERNPEIFKTVLKTYGYKKAADVKLTYYNKIVTSFEDAVKNIKESE